MNDAQDSLVVFDRQNAWRVVAVVVVMLAFLWAASAATSLVVVGFCAIGFSVVAALSYDALLHESYHRNLHRNPAFNDGMGRLLALLFPCSWTLVRQSHLQHHRHNRTDFEKFDFYDHESEQFRRTVHWYGLLVGLFGISLPTISLGAALWPGFFSGRAVAQNKLFEPLFGGNFLRPETVRAIRFEAFAGVVLWVDLALVLGLKLWPTLVLFVAFWVVWSSRANATHAFSSRDVVEGAHNLKVARWHGWLIMGRHLELAHHRYPRKRWQAIVRLTETESPPELAFWRQYLRQWKGPVKSTEPAPDPLPLQLALESSNARWSS